MLGWGEEDIGAYVAAVRALPKRWGLDRLLPPNDERGARLIHHWCQRRRAAGGQRPVGWLTAGLTEAEHVAEIGEVVARSVTDLGELVAVDELVRPVVRIEIVDEWDPERESRADAYKRLGAFAKEKIRDELDRLARDAEAKGYVFPDRAPKLQRDLDRLAGLMTGRATVTGLAGDETDPTTIDREGAVVRSIRRIAKRAGVSVRGWKLPRS